MLGLVPWLVHVRGAHVGACKGRSIMRARALEHTRKGGRRRQGYRDRHWERGREAVLCQVQEEQWVGKREVLLCRWTDSFSLFQLIPASGGSRTTRPCSRSLRPRAHPHRRTLLWHPHRSRIPRARSCLRKWLVIVCTRARTKGAAAPGFCTVRPCPQSIEVSGREHIHAIPT